MTSSGMTALSSIDPFQIRELILNARHPIVLRNVRLDWDIAQGTLADWCRKYDKALNNAPVHFERLKRQNGSTPQYERFRQNVPMTTMEFLEEHTTAQDHWDALSYRRPSDIPDICRKGVQFDCFGFPEGKEDCAYWLGSGGANTPCHYDSYGCNIVVQVFGRKSWLLFPPEAALVTSRIPYEESSVYCTHNFYSPTPGNAFQEFENDAYHCVLEANSVLIVPRHWWHFVEALELSLSVNYWVPLQTDSIDQLEECLVQNIVKQFINAYDCQGEVAQHILNPNETSLLDTDVFTRGILTQLIDEHNESNPTKHAYQTFSEENFDELLRKLPMAQRVPRMGEEKFRRFIDTNSKRFDQRFELEDGDAMPISTEQQVFLNSLCSPTVVQSLREEFRKRYKSPT